MISLGLEMRRIIGTRYWPFTAEQKDFLEKSITERLLSQIGGEWPVYLRCIEQCTGDVEDGDAKLRARIALNVLDGFVGPDAQIKFEAALQEDIERHREELEAMFAGLMQLIPEDLFLVR